MSNPRTTASRVGGVTDYLALPMVAAPRLRNDAARNGVRLLKIARRLVREFGAEAVTMDAVAAAAGVGKGTVFRRFGSRAGLFTTLLDEDETAAQNAYLFGPPPLGPGAPPVDRLLAYGRARLRFVQSHLSLLLSTVHNADVHDTGAARLERTHVRILLENASTSGNLDVQVDALTNLLNAVYVAHQLHCGHSLKSMSDAWDDLARKLTRP
jgi:AcrR family transcriptional regulator